MKKTDLRGAPERRALPSRFEVRAASDAELVLSGYASVFDAPYDIMGGPPYGFSEVVDSRAFDVTLKANPDVHLLINHEGMPLARTRSKTLDLSTDTHGLRVRASLDRGDPDVQRLERKMTRGDMDEMSFAFRTIRDEWNDTESERRLMEVSLDKGDVSVVNFGANPATHTELQRALRALSGAQPEVLAAVRHAGGVNFIAARTAIDRLLTSDGASRTRRALDVQDVNILTQAMGWFTAIDSITDGVVEGDPEYAGVDLASLIVAIDAIADEAQEAISTYLGVPTPDPDDDTPGAEALQRALDTLTRAGEEQLAEIRRASVVDLAATQRMLGRILRGKVSATGRLSVAEAAALINS